MPIKDLLGAFIEDVWNEGDTYRLAELASDDLTISPFPPDLPADRDGYALFVLMLRGAFPDLNITIEEILTDGDKAAVRCILTGTHLGDLAGLAATNRTVSVDQVMIVHTSGDRITALYSVINGFDMLEQLGAIPDFAA